MKKFKFKKISIVTVLVIALVFSINKLMPAYAAANPNLGLASTFSVIAQTAITGTPTSISGDVGMNNVSSSITGVAGPVVAGTIYATDAVPVAPGEAVIDPNVQANLSTAYANIKLLPVEGTPIVVSELGGITRGPGVYDVPGNATLSGGVLTLDGAGTYIFRTDTSSSLTSSAGGSINFINGARACDLFWNIGTEANIGGTSFAGTIIAHTGIHFTNAGVALNGRALAEGADVTLNVNGSISGPTCAAPVATLNVVKVVVNNNGKSNVVSDFPLFVNGTPVTSGVTTSGLVAGTYTVTETSNSNYTQTFSASCPGGIITLAAGETGLCTITNDDISAPSGSSGGGSSVTYGCKDPIATNYNAFAQSRPELCVYGVGAPILSLVKVPTPLALPAGPGPVSYAYTLNNVGTTPVNTVSVTDNFCSPVTFVSGDTNLDAKLDLNETWKYNCSKTLSVTTTNTATATGWTNGISTTDIAYATVVVGAPVVPPLIHVTKVPSPLALLVGPGMVTYTEKITNPGVTALSNIIISDDKCSPLNYVSGDLNNDSKLDTTETWTYTCQTNLIKTTTNTVRAQGTVDGLIAKDFAIATVIVSTPGLPKTGFPPRGENTILYVIISAGILIFSSSLYLVKK